MEYYNNQTDELSQPAFQGKNALKYWLVNDTISKLLGEVLTVIDASITGEQNSAIKSLIKDKFSKRQDQIFWFAFRDIEPEGEGHAPSVYWEKGLVPFDESETYSFKMSD